MKTLAYLLIVLMVLSLTSCSKNSPIGPIGKSESNEGYAVTLVKKIAPITDIVLVDDRFVASVFYSMEATGDIAPLNDNKLLVIKEWGENIGVYEVKRGNEYNIDDISSTTSAWHFSIKQMTFISPRHTPDSAADPPRTPA